jgi:hypothetical protein
MVSGASFNSKKDYSSRIRIPDSGGKKHRIPDLGSATLGGPLYDPAVLAESCKSRVICFTSVPVAPVLEKS